MAIIGTFAAMAAFGFSLNNLTLFGLVLAIGIVVDDAIVVVEAVEHHIEHGLAPREATIKAMEQVSGPVIAVGLVLSAVFVPCAFISGITGQFFRQFALTIAVSTIISAFNSLTLSPALTALLLRPRDKERTAPPLAAAGVRVARGGWLWWLAGLRSGCEAHWTTDRHGRRRLRYRLLVLAFSPGARGLVPEPAAQRAAGFAFRLVSTPAFGAIARLYATVGGSCCRFSGVALLIYAGLIVLTYFGFITTAKGFIPNQDMGYLMVNVQLPDSASMERTQEVMRLADKITRAHPGVKHATAIAGQSFALYAIGSNFGSMFVNLNPIRPATSARTMTPEDRKSSARYGGRHRQLFAPRVQPDSRRQHRRVRPAAGARRRPGRRVRLRARGPRRPRPEGIAKAGGAAGGAGQQPAAVGASDRHDYDNLAELAKEHPEIDKQPGLVGLVHRVSAPTCRSCRSSPIRARSLPARSASRMLPPR